MNKIFSFFILIIFTQIVHAQNVGIGTLNPTLGKLEVYGAFGLGKTVAAFGSDGPGISLQRNSPAIGFNQYHDETGSKYMSNGYASTITLNENTGTLSIDMYGDGLKDGYTINKKNALTFLKSGNVGIQDPGRVDATLIVSKNLNFGSVSIIGVGRSQDNHFAYGFYENTYIRPGHLLGELIFNEVPNGKIIIPTPTSIGYGGTTNPLTTLELYGGLAISKRDTFNLSAQNNLYTPTNASIVLVSPASPNMTELLLADGQVEGQILMILIDGTSNNGTFLNDSGNIDLSGQIVMQYSDVLTLMWRKLTATTGRWTEISFRQNQH